MLRSVRGGRNVAAVASIFAVLIAWAGPVHAGTFSCNQDSTGPFCTYEGNLERVYINEQNGAPWILLYFDALIDLSIAQAQGITDVTRSDAARFTIADGAVFAEYLYSTALSALVAEKKVVLFLRGQTSGYFKIDRIWIKR